MGITIQRATDRARFGKDCNSLEETGGTNAAEVRSRRTTQKGKLDRHRECHQNFLGSVHRRWEWRTCRVESPRPLLRLRLNDDNSGGAYGRVC
jgi:hypothetical protein